MAIVRRLVLDILKPRQPNVLTFSNAIADVADYEGIVLLEDSDTFTPMALVLCGTTWLNHRQ